MSNSEWVIWTVRACCRIRLGYDRRAAERELLAHLEDEAEAIRREKELTAYEAEQQALAAMGDADEVGRQLAAVHKPWLGYLWLWSRRVLIVCIAVAVLAALGFSERVGFDWNVSGDNPRYWQEKSWYIDHTTAGTWTEFTPDCRDESDGYTFTVPAAARVHNEDYTAEYEGVPHEVEENTSLYVTVRATSLLPSTEGCAAFWDFYAVDDLGNHYWSWTDPDVIYTWQYQRSLVGNTYTTGLWTSEYQAWISEIDRSASWIELRYDRDGRDVRLRIDLTGGEKP